MFTYGKTATNAIAVMSYLAATAPRRVGSAVIGKERDLSPVFTAKLLSRLASAGYLNSQPGPGGGYALTKDPARIRLIEIVALFEQIDEGSRCPFGASWCGHGEPCPLHDTIIDLGARNRRFLEETRLSVFQTKPSRAKSPQSCVKTAAKRPTPNTKPRHSGKPTT